MLRLEPKELFDTGEVQLPRHRSERIGPYTVLREVARAPGARLVEAEGPGDTRVLLQVVRLRAPDDEADRVARQRYERALGARTAALFDELDLEIRAQGGADLSDGTRWIYWARAWSGTPVDGSALSPDDLVGLARDLLERLTRRHALNRTEPLLSEHALWRCANGRFSVAGVPVGVESAWMAPSEDPPLRAPGESADGDATGDLWRLGQALRALAGGREVPSTLRGLIDSLGDDLSATDAPADAVTARPRAPSADVALRALGADPESMPTGPTPVVAAPPPSWADAVPREPPTAPAHTIADSEVTADIRARPDAIDAATTRIELVPPQPMAAIVRAPIDSAELATIEAPGPHEHNTDPALGSADAVTHQTRPRELAPPMMPAVVTIDPSELAIAAEGAATQESVGRRPWSGAPTALGTSTQRLFSVTDTVTDGKPLPRMPKVDDAPVDPAAVAWAPALLPEGASPWSEVVTARPARAKFTGFPGELPELGPDDVIEATTPHALVRASEPPGPLGVPTPAVTLVSVRPSAPPAGLTPARRMAIAAGATLLVLGLVAQWSRDRSAPIEAMEGLVVTAVNEVTLDAQPSGTTVVSEADGRVLGTTPMRFVVPQAADAAVLLLRAGFDPQRLVLPDRGGIVAVLTPVATTACELGIEVQPEGEIEGVGTDLGRGPRYTIPGAAVVRTKAAGAAGARIVRCPEAPREAPVRLRFGAAHEPATVRITHPAGATASIEGTEVGVVPAARAVASAFARVRITDASGAVTERWIPSRGDVEVQMPTAARADLTAPAVVDPTPIAVAMAARPAEPRRDLARGKAEALSLLREGTELLQAGHAETARTRLQACLRADPTAAACHRGLAEVFRREESVTEARAHYQRYLELAPDAPDAALVRSLVRQLE